MSKTSINLRKTDKDYLRAIGGGNLSAGVRMCLEYYRNANKIKDELREIVGQPVSQAPVQEEQPIIETKQPEKVSDTEIEKKLEKLVWRF